MPRARKTPRKPRLKIVKVQLVPRPEKRAKPDELEPYSYVDRLVREHHDDLAKARIAVAWMLDVKPDRDGHLTLGRLKKATDLDREFREYDLVVMLNSTVWKNLDNKQRTALVDHELCHAALQRDKNGEPIRDERDRLCYRTRKHDIEEFVAVVKRHGMYLSDIAELVKAAAESPLFGQQNGGTS